MMNKARRRRNPDAGPRPIPVILVQLALVVFATGTAAEEPRGSLLDAAHRAGLAVSATVFEDRGSQPEAGAAPSRVSGKAIVLATAIASAAVVTAAWLLGRNQCEPGIVEIDWAAILNWPPADHPDDVPVPPRPLPEPLPMVCVPR